VVGKVGMNVGLDKIATRQKQTETDNEMAVILVHSSVPTISYAI
jgi:hypothetical protein